MIRRRFAAFAVAGLVLSLSLCLSGCSFGLKDAYSLKWISGPELSLNLGYFP